MTVENSKWMTVAEKKVPWKQNSGGSDVMNVEYWTLNTNNVFIEKWIDVRCVNTKYIKTKAKNAKNRSVDLPQLSLRREPT